MSDVRMAELLRRYLASGDLDTGARLLQERLRTGAVTRAQVLVAKRLGDSVAAMLLPGAPRAEPVRPPAPRPRRRPSLKAALQHVGGSRRGYGILDRDRRLAVLVAFAAARHAGGTGPALEAAVAWIACPCPAHVAPAVGVALREPPEGPRPGVERAVWALAATLVAEDDREADRLALGAVRAAAYARGAWVRCGGCGSSPPCSSCGWLPETSGLLVAIDGAVRSWVVFGSM